MQEITLTELREILTECAGEDESVDLGGEIMDTPFAELGYDSLALIETAARIKQRFGVAIEDDEVAELETPREIISVVNESLVETA
jgi:act minimal PKS acyl carrier protein